MPALEDKVVQRTIAEVLNAIYEQDFLGFSYGFSGNTYSDRTNETLPPLRSWKTNQPP